MKTEALPVTVGALGLIRKGMNQNSGKILGASNISELQKIILLGTVHIILTVPDKRQVSGQKPDGNRYLTRHRQK